MRSGKESARKKTNCDETGNDEKKEVEPGQSRTTNVHLQALQARHEGRHREVGNDVDEGVLHTQNPRRFPRFVVVVSKKIRRKQLRLPSFCSKRVFSRRKPTTHFRVPLCFS